uniref:J domain-containing protein n=1 Tax=Eptatretus burgeri TaxID=7764 RepID=A0A8C4R5T3_EPTBU
CVFISSCLQMEQILREYKVRVLQCHPDKHPDNPTAGSPLEKRKDLMSEAMMDSITLLMIGLFFKWQMTLSKLEGEERKREREKERKREREKERKREREKESYSDESFAHGGFLWTADAPSELLRKFRNYEM